MSIELIPDFEVHFLLSFRKDIQYFIGTLTSQNVLHKRKKNESQHKALPFSLYDLEVKLYTFVKSNHIKIVLHSSSPCHLKHITVQSHSFLEFLPLQFSSPFNFLRAIRLLLEREGI